MSGKIHPENKKGEKIMARKERLRDPNHLSFGRLLAFKSSDVSVAWIQVIMLNYLSIYASDTLGVGVRTVGTLLLASKIVDAFTDVFAGWLVDNTHTKWGTGRTYEPCIIGMTLCTVLLFAAKPEWSEFAKCAWIFMMYTFTFSIFSTLRAAGMNPYTIRHFSNNPVLLKKVASYGGIVTMFGSVIVSTAFPVLMSRVATTASGWTRAVLMVMIPATVIGLFRFLICKEDPSVGEGEEHAKVNLKEIFTLFAKNKYVWIYAVIMLCYNVITNLAVGTYYFKYIVGNTEQLGLLSIFGIVLLPLMLVFPVIMKKIGTMGKMLTYFCGIGVIGYLICFFSKGFVPGVLVGYLLGTFATLPIAYYSILFIMNICNYNEMIGLPRMEGSSGILSNFATKFGAAIGAWVTGFLLSLGGYISTTGEEIVAQPAAALTMIRVDFALVPAVLLVVIAVCAFAFSKLEPKAEAFENEKEAKLAAAANAVEEAIADVEAVVE